MCCDVLVLLLVRAGISEVASSLSSMLFSTSQILSSWLMGLCLHVSGWGSVSGVSNRVPCRSVLSDGDDSKASSNSGVANLSPGSSSAVYISYCIRNNVEDCDQEWRRTRRVFWCCLRPLRILVSLVSIHAEVQMLEVMKPPNWLAHYPLWCFALARICYRDRLAAVYARTKQILVVVAFLEYQKGFHAKLHLVEELCLVHRQILVLQI